MASINCSSSLLPSSSLESPAARTVFPISLATPIPKLGMRGAGPGRLFPVMNLTLPTCTSSASDGRDNTSSSISRSLCSIVTIFGRRLGSCERHSSASCRKAGGHPWLDPIMVRTSLSSIPNVGAPRLKVWSSASFLAPISQRIIPNEKMSVDNPNSSPSRISGDMYASVPQKVRRLLSSALRAAIRANPKSVILSRPLAVTSKFSPLRSR